uniref:G-protein coupled receptors family 1 profile domain-containing protein n=1 Tax=Panagrolaimus sp. ES5 TaxID=591445 RepID=A0AC34F3J1_9BILA
MTLSSTVLPLLSRFDEILTTSIPIPMESFIRPETILLNSTVSPITAIPLVHPYITFAKQIYVWLVPLMITVLTIAVIGNGLIVISAPWLSKPVNPYHRLCVSLAAADTWAASLLITGLIVNSYLPVVFGVHKKMECFAAFLEIFRISGMLTSNLHILALTLHQFVGIVYPLRYKLILTTKRQRILIFILWIVPLIFIFTWFIAIPNDGFRHPTCQLTFYRRLPFRFCVFISFMIPLFATFALYGYILFTLLKAKSKLQLNQSLQDNRRVKSNIKLVWTTLLILSTFTLSWGVCVLYFVLVCIDGCIFVYRLSVSFHVGFLLNSTVNFLVMIKLLLNPLIYALRMKHVRTSVIRFLQITCFRCFTTSFKTENNANYTTAYHGLYSYINDKNEIVHCTSRNNINLRRTTFDASFVLKQQQQPKRHSMSPKMPQKRTIRSSSSAFETKSRMSIMR